MGVRGLTSYIAQRAEEYLLPFELHDCNLVIDGDNLACNLYKDVTGTCSAFGGDYDDFYRAVVNFFTVLKECNVQAFVLCDGGYEARKMRTVAARLRGKISVIKRINPSGSVPVFPVMMKEVFIDAVKDCGIPVMRCVFEADDELAALGRKLNCPVLSYDSDFYIHNVLYIPLITLTLRAHTKVLKDTKNSSEVRRLRKNEAKCVQKRMIAQKMDKIHVVKDGKCKESKSQKKTYKFLDCCIYRIDHLVARGCLSKEKLPLFAALLGNDYIARSAFRNFFAVGLGKSGRSRKMKQQQRRIKVIQQWLRTETVQSALQKILSRLKKNQRESLEAQVNAAISGYSNEKCESYDYFAENYADILSRYPPQNPNEMLDTEDEDEYEECEDVQEDLAENEYEYEDVGDVSKEDQLNQLNSENKTGGEKECESDEEATTADDEENEEDCDSIENEEEEEEGNSFTFPSWFLEKLYPCNLPRFLVDLMYLRKYINSPQIEHFPYHESNEIALPILIYIFSLINKVDGEEPRHLIAADGTPLPIELTYVTRLVKVTDLHYKRFAAIPDSIKYPFDPSAPNSLLLRQIFDETPKLNVETLLQNLNDIPDNLRLYFLAIVYWLHRSQYCDLYHLQAIILCLVVLQTVDAKIPAERDIRTFQKRFGKIIRTERQVRDKEVAQGVKRNLKPEVEALTIPERMAFIPKSDCLLVQNNLLKHFHLQEMFKKKYDHYSTIVLHAFSEFQSVVFQLNALNALLDFPYKSSHMGQLYSGVFIYNLYDLLKSRIDTKFYIEKFLLQDSKMMFDYFCYLYNWCDTFVPSWKRFNDNLQQTTAAVVVNKKLLKKKRQAARKKAAELNAKKILFGGESQEIATEEKERGEGDDFNDLNNKFSTLLKVS